jgi:O-acetylserine/cysteine efflux transporter
LSDKFQTLIVDHSYMTTDRRRAVAALTAAGLLWGTTVPLSKLALGWLAPGWLTLLRFALAAAILLVVGRRQLRAACTLPVLASGAAGYGGAVLLQNAGIDRTSVSHAALLIGATPVLVAVIAALWHHAVARPVAWVGFAVSLAGVGLVTGGGGGGATVGGDGLVLASLLLSAMFTVAQGRLLRGRDPVAVTAVQFLGAALAVLPFSVIAEGMPAAPAAPGPVLATAGLVAGGTLLPFTLFAYAQSRVAAEVAGAFFNIEPLVGAVAGVVIFGNPAGPEQLVGGAAILAGIALSSLPLIGAGRPQVQQQEGTGQPPPRVGSRPASPGARHAPHVRRVLPARHRSRRHLGGPRGSAAPRRWPPARRPRQRRQAPRRVDLRRRGRRPASARSAGRGDAERVRLLVQPEGERRLGRRLRQLVLVGGPPDRGAGGRELGRVHPPDVVRDIHGHADDA